MPGFDPEEITTSWGDGVLDIAAEHEDDRRGERKTYHGRFRFPKNVESDDVEAEYTNGLPELRLPVETGAPTRGTEIGIEA